jgi:hypothetical protein
VPGASGQVRVGFGEAADLKDAKWTPWATVNADADFAHQFRVSDLKPGVRYYLRIEGRKAEGKPVVQRCVVNVLGQRAVWRSRSAVQFAFQFH